MTHVGDTSHSCGFLQSWHEMEYGDRTWRFWYKSEFPHPVADVFQPLCAPVTAIPPLALPPDGRGVFPLIKPEKNPATIRRGWKFCCLRPKSSAAATREIPVSTGATESPLSQHRASHRVGGEAASLSTAHSLDQVENKDVWPTG